jgi:hypothetical protein
MHDFKNPLQRTDFKRDCYLRACLFKREEGLATIYLHTDNSNLYHSYMPRENGGGG